MMLGQRTSPDRDVGAATMVNDGRCRVLLADDHEILLDMLRNLLEPEFAVIGAVTDGIALLQAAEHLQPDIALIDVIMPGLSGLEAGWQLRARLPAIKLVYLTMEANEAVAAEAFAIGASAVLWKVCSAIELEKAMHIVAAGGRYLAPGIDQADIDALRQAHLEKPIAKLSPRELEVVRLLVTGLSMKSVARRLGITPRTVAFHKYHAMGALGLHGNSELIKFAIHHRLLSGVDTVTARDMHGRPPICRENA
jgi:DNA-binding NarL/FixJ family response regulator